MPSLHFDMKNALPHLCQESRLNVLMVLILHANIRNRCWPSIDTIAALATGSNRNKVIAAKKWLVEVGAIEVVPFAKRMSDEKALPVRQAVYQLTGILNIENVQIPYLYHAGESTTIDTFKSIDGDTFKSTTIQTGSRSIKKIKDSVGMSANDASKASKSKPKLSVEENHRRADIAIAFGQYIGIESVGINRKTTDKIADAFTTLTGEQMQAALARYQRLYPDRTEKLRKADTIIPYVAEYLAEVKPAETTAAAKKYGCSHCQAPLGDGNGYLYVSDTEVAPCPHCRGEVQ